MSTTDQVVRLFLDDIREQFLRARHLAERSFAQLSDKEFLSPPSMGDLNSVAILTKHMGCNLISRWTDFLTTDGESPQRDRDREFVLSESDTREALMSLWDRGWGELFATLDGLTHADLARTVTIRGEPHSVPGAVTRSLTHVAYHVGQIVYASRLARGPDWMTLSIPRGGSGAHNQEMFKRFGSNA